MGTKKYKLKTTFDEFYVEERHNFDLITNGDYLLFKLEKSEVIKKIWESENAYMEISKNVSRYATRHIDEMIADAWAEYLNNPNPTGVIKTIGDEIVRIASGGKP